MTNDKINATLNEIVHLAGTAILEDNVKVKIQAVADIVMMAIQIIIPSK